VGFRLSGLVGFVTVIGLDFPERLPAEFEPVGVVHDAVEDGVCERWLADYVVPCVQRQLAGDDCRSCSIAVFDDFHEIAALRSGQPIRPPVVEDEQLGFGQTAEQPGEAPVTVGEFQLVEEPGQALVERRDPGPAGGLGQSAGQPGFADPARARNILPAIRVLRFGFVIRFILGRGRVFELLRAVFTAVSRI
jgi:hypothetical protein